MSILYWIPAFAAAGIHRDDEYLNRRQTCPGLDLRFLFALLAGMTTYWTAY